MQRIAASIYEIVTRKFLRLALTARLLFLSPACNFFEAFSNPNASNSIIYSEANTVLSQVIECDRNNERLFLLSRGGWIKDQTDEVTFSSFKIIAISLC